MTNFIIRKTANFLDFYMTASGVSSSDINEAKRFSSAEEARDFLAEHRPNQTSADLFTIIIGPGPKPEPLDNQIVVLAELRFIVDVDPEDSIYTLLDAKRFAEREVRETIEDCSIDNYDEYVSFKITKSYLRDD